MKTFPEMKITTTPNSPLFFQDLTPAENHPSLPEIREKLSQFCDSLSSGRESNISNFEELVVKIDNQPIYEQIDDEIRKSQIFKKGFSEVASGTCRIGKFKMHILNFFAYKMNLAVLMILFDIFKEIDCLINIETDDFHNDVLDIAIKSQFHDMIVLIIEKISENPPGFGKWPSLNAEKLLRLFELRIPCVGKLIDSRFFTLNLKTESLSSFPFRYYKVLFSDSFPIDENQIKSELIKSEPSNFCFFESSKLCRKAKIQILDVKDLTKDGKTINKLLNTIAENCEIDHDIFASKFLESLIDVKFFSYALFVQLKELIIYIFEAILYAYMMVNRYICAACDQSPVEETWIGIGICCYIVCYLLVNESREIIKSGFSRYITNPRNVIDILYIVSYSSYLIFAVVIVAGQYNQTSAFDPSPVEQVLRCVALFFLSIRIFYILQLVDFVGSTVRVIYNSVVYSLKLGIVFLMIMAALTISIGALQNTNATINTNKYNLYLVYAIYSLVLGDTSTYFELAYENPTLISLYYVIYFAISSVLIIIMLNLWITVIADGYGRGKEILKNYSNKSYFDLILADDNNYSFKNKKSKRTKWIHYLRDGILEFFKLIFKGEISVNRWLEGSYYVISHIPTVEETFSDLKTQSKKLIFNKED